MKQKKEKRVLVVLGAGESQIPVILQAGGLNLSVIGVDRDPDAPGFKYCEGRICASTYDAAAILQGLDKMKDLGRIVGIVTRSNGVPTVTRALVADYYGLPGPDTEASQIAISKRRTIGTAKTLDIPVPYQYDPKLQETFRFPMVVKPDITMEGKKGVRLIRSSLELQHYFANEKHYSKHSQMEYESYVEGSDVLAIAPVFEGEVYRWLLLDEHVGLDEQGQFFGVGFTLPSQMTCADTVWEQVEALVRGLGLKEGVFIGAFRVSPLGSGPPILIEVHLDMGGDLVMDTLVPAMCTGQPFKDVLLKPFIGLRPQLPLPRPGVSTLLYLTQTHMLDDNLLEDVSEQLGVISCASPSVDSGRRGHVVVRSKSVGAHKKRVKCLHELLYRQNCAPRVVNGVGI